MASGKWPNGARAAIALTFDNMGEAADLNRNLWPADQPIGRHYSVTKVLPEFLALVRAHNIAVTYFVESWNLGVYPDAIKQIEKQGHEVAWHAWQHEAWNSLDQQGERENFERSFGREEGIRGFVERERQHLDNEVELYRGFRPPGGIIHGERTLNLCREFGLGYISPAAEEGAEVPLNHGRDSIVVLPFKWKTVDAYYYMDAFSGLREIKGDPEATQSPGDLTKAYIEQIDQTIEKGGFLSLLFHPFLTDRAERMQAMGKVLQHLVKKRAQGDIWLARCRDIEQWVRTNPGVVGKDPAWDNSSWR